MNDMLDFTHDTVPAPLEPVWIADDLLWLRLPLPFALNHVNLWLLRDGDGWLLIDTGIATDQLRQVWTQLLHDGDLADKPITRILATHFHPDHIGLAGWLCGRFGAPLLAARTEWQKARLLSLDDSDRLTATVSGFYRQAGVGPEALLNISERGNLYARRVSPIPRSFQRLQDGETLRIGGTDWRVITTPGHAPEMICLHSAERNILIAADHILPEISPNVSVWPDEPLADPLHEFRASLHKIRAQVPADCLVLPSHGRPFRGLHARIDWLDAHHDERLDATMNACRQPDATALQVMLTLFPRALDPHQWGFAMGEALAHLNYLIVEKRLTAQSDPQGVLRYIPQ